MATINSLPVSASYGVFANLNAEKAVLYRAILEVFVAERARFTLAIRPGEIEAALVARIPDPPPALEIEAALRQLKDWGNLDDSPDTAEVASVEEFYRQRRLYQLSAAGEAAEQAIAVFVEHLQRPGELQTTALHDIMELLDALSLLVGQDLVDDAKIHHTLSGLAQRFEQLTVRAQSFMRGLQRTVDLHGISVDAFLAYKETLIDYIERFIGELVVATNRIAGALRQLEVAGRVAGAFAAAARRELVDALDPTPSLLAQAEARWRERWNGLRRWFIADAGQSQAELLRARARSAIPALLTAVTQINDRRAGRADRAADFQALARWFAQAPDDAAAHRLWRAALALSPARHLRINEETLSARARLGELPRVSWLTAEPMWISPRLREMGRHAARGPAHATIDRSREKEHIFTLAREQTRQLEQAWTRLLHLGRRRLAELGPLEPAQFRLFLELLGEALVRRTDATLPIETASVDGSMRLVLEPVPGGAVVALDTGEGVFQGRDHWITIEAAFPTQARS